MHLTACLNFIVILTVYEKINGLIFFFLTDYLSLDMRKRSEAVCRRRDYNLQLRCHHQNDCRGTGGDLEKREWGRGEL